MSEVENSAVKAPLDLSTLDLAPGADAGAVMQLVHPVTGDDTGIAFDVMGSDAPIFRVNLRRLYDLIARKPDDPELDPDHLKILAEARLAACAMKGWTGLIWKGAGLQYSFDNAVMVMTALPWIVQQVTFFRDRRSNFFKA